MQKTAGRPFLILSVKDGFVTSMLILCNLPVGRKMNHFTILKLAKNV